MVSLPRTNEARARARTETRARDGSGPVSLLDRERAASRTARRPRRNFAGALQYPSPPAPMERQGLWATFSAPRDLSFRNWRLRGRTSRRGWPRAQDIPAQKPKEACAKESCVALRQQRCVGMATISGSALVRDRERLRPLRGSAYAAFVDEGRARSRQDRFQWERSASGNARGSNGFPPYELRRQYAPR